MNEFLEIRYLTKLKKQGQSFKSKIEATRGYREANNEYFELCRILGYMEGDIIFHIENKYSSSTCKIEKFYYDELSLRVSITKDSKPKSEKWSFSEIQGDKKFNAEDIFFWAKEVDDAIKILKPKISINFSNQIREHLFDESLGFMCALNSESDSFMILLNRIFKEIDICLKQSSRSDLNKNLKNDSKKLYWDGLEISEGENIKVTKNEIKNYSFILDHLCYPRKNDDLRIKHKLAKTFCHKIECEFTESLKFIDKCLNELPEGIKILDEDHIIQIFIKKCEEKLNKETPFNLGLLVVEQVFENVKTISIVDYYKLLQENGKTGDLKYDTSDDNLIEHIKEKVGSHKRSVNRFLNNKGLNNFNIKIKKDLIYICPKSNFWKKEIQGSRLSYDDNLKTQ